MHESVKKLLQGVIISCQAYEDTPLYGPENMKKMAECAILGGASGLRACWAQDIKAIRSITDLPIIGIDKVESDKDPLDEIIITPNFSSACKIIESGADILALDCTIRDKRNFDELYALLFKIKEKYPQIPVMADISTLEEGVKVAETGLVDIVSTTLSGYTRESLSNVCNGPDIKLVQDLKKHIEIPVNAEGRIWDLHDMKSVLDAGADMVTLGTAVTRPHLIAERFGQFNAEYHKHSQ